MSVGGAGVYLLDYGAGNVLSVANAVKAVGGELKLITEAADFDKVRRVCVGRARRQKKFLLSFFRTWCDGSSAPLLDGVAPHVRSACYRAVEPPSCQVSVASNAEH